MNYLRRLFISLDIMINVLLGGDIETISSRMGRSIQAGSKCILCRFFCGALNMFWKDHCVNNIMDPVK